MRPIPIVLVALFVVACGPTAQVVTSPTPVSSGAPSTGPTATSSALGTPPPSPLLSPTPLPLTSPTPLSLDTPTPFVPTPVPSGGSSGAPFGPFTRLDSFPTSNAFEVTDVAATPGGYIAVGFGGLDGASYDGLRQGIIWTSVDGREWIELFDPTLANVTPLRIVARGTDLFLAGTLAYCPEFEENCTEVPQAGNGVWRSANGGPWELLPQLADMQNGFVDGMLLAGDQLVVFGGAGDADQPTVWMSHDGATWTSTTDLAGMEPVTALAVGPAGFSAFGTRYEDNLFDVTLIAATSGDGVHFSPANAPSMDGSGIDGVASGPAGMAGVGYHSTDLFATNGVAVWSSDGANWSEATDSDGSFADSGLQLVHALAAGGYIALGYKPHVDDFVEDGLAWFSADGSDWDLIARLDGAFSVLSSSALGQGGIVAFAAEQIEADDGTFSSVIHAWFAPLSELHG